MPVKLNRRSSPGLNHHTFRRLRDRRCHYRIDACQDYAKNAKALALLSSHRQRILDFEHIIIAVAVSYRVFVWFLRPTCSDHR